MKNLVNKGEKKTNFEKSAVFDVKRKVDKNNTDKALDVINHTSRVKGK